MRLLEEHSDNKMRVLILKDNYNTFEKYYITELNSIGYETKFYYKDSSLLRKLFTHYGLPFDYVWYGDWKRNINDYDIIVVFDSLHNSKLLKYIRKRFFGRLVFWHWNPMKKKKDIKIWAETKNDCEHWTFNPSDSKEYSMKLNNQFFFFQNIENAEKENKVFFIGADKGRYDQLLSYTQLIKNTGYNADVHVVCNNPSKYPDSTICQTQYMEYDKVIENVKKSKAVLEINQEGQVGLTARTLEAMFFGTKLITNNKSVKSYSFYNKNNIFIVGVDNISSLEFFLNSSFQNIDREKIYSFSAQGWIENFINESS